MAIITAALIGLIVGAIVGTVIGAVVAGVVSYDSGARGWELAGDILFGAFLGSIIGGIAGLLIGAGIGAAPAIGSFLGSSFTLGSFMTASGEAVAVSVSGIQIIQAFSLTIGLGILLSKNSDGTQDPYARPNQKKRYREFKYKARKQIGWESRSGKRRVKPPKSHTPGREHKKFLFWFLLWPLLDEFK